MKHLGFVILHFFLGGVGVPPPPLCPPCPPAAGLFLPLPGCLSLPFSSSSFFFPPANASFFVKPLEKVGTMGAATMANAIIVAIVYTLIFFMSFFPLFQIPAGEGGGYE